MFGQRRRQTRIPVVSRECRFALAFLINVGVLLRSEAPGHCDGPVEAYEASVSLDEHGEAYASAHFLFCSDASGLSYVESTVTNPSAESLVGLLYAPVLDLSSLGEGTSTPSAGSAIQCLPYEMVASEAARLPVHPAHPMARLDPIVKPGTTRTFRFHYHPFICRGFNSDSQDPHEPFTRMLKQAIAQDRAPRAAIYSAKGLASVIFSPEGQDHPTMRITGLRKASRTRCARDDFFAPTQIAAVNGMANVGTPQPKMACGGKKWKPFRDAAEEYCRTSRTGQPASVRRLEEGDCRAVLESMKTCENTGPAELNAGETRAEVRLGPVNGEHYTIRFMQADGPWRVEQLGPTPMPGTITCGSKEYEPFSAAIDTYCTKGRAKPVGFCDAVQPALRTCIYRDFPLGRTASAVVDRSLTTPSGEVYVSFQADGEASDGHSWMVYFKTCHKTWTVSRVTVEKFEDGTGSMEGEFPGPIQCSGGAE
jgi:hypothetical protein